MTADWGSRAPQSRLSRRCRTRSTSGWSSRAGYVYGYLLKACQTTRCNDCLEQGKPFCVIALLNTWCNVWPTSYRTRSPTGACIYGCTESVSLLHYMTCPVFWSLLREMAKRHEDVENDELLHNLGLAGEIKSNFLSLAIALDVYSNNLKSMVLPRVAVIRSPFK